MFFGLFRRKDDLDLDAIEAKLDALHAAADERIAAKEAQLKELTEKCDKARKTVDDLKTQVSHWEKATNRQLN